MATMMIDLLKRSRRPRYLPLLVAALVMAALFALPAERSGAQTWLPEVSVESQDDVNEGNDAVFIITASQTSTSDLTIAVTVGEWPASGNVATVADTGPKTVTIPAGQTRATLRVGTVDDSAKEPRGIITAQLTAPGNNAGYRVSRSAGWSTVVVSDDDYAIPQVSISRWSDLYTSEAWGKVWFTLTPSSTPYQGVTVNVNVTATGDFGVKTGIYTVTLPTTGDGSATFKVPLIADHVNEPNGTVTATVQAGDGYTVGAPAAATIHVTDDDTPKVRVSGGADVEEGQAATFTVTASPAPYQSLPVTVDVVASGLSGVNDGVKTVTVPTGGSATLSVGTTDDNVESQGGTITATVQPGSGYGVGNPSSGSVDVADNDGPVITITGGGAVTEGGDATFTLTANPAPSNNWLSVSVAIGATGEFGVSKGARTVSVPLVSSHDFTVATTDDNLDEPDGAVTATVKAGYGYRVGDPAEASVTVNDDEATPVNNPTITIAGGPDINEGEDATFTITATPPLADGQTLMVTLKSEVPGLINIDRKETITGATTTFTQPSDDNNYDEADYSMSFSIKASNGYRVGSPSKASVNIIDDDLPKVSIRAADYERGRNGVPENGTATFGIYINPASYQDVTVSLTVTTTGDFGVPNGVREVIVPVRRSAELRISPVPDHEDEPDGSITVTVNANSNYEIVGSGSASVVVTDDDEPSGPRLTISDAQDKARAGGKLEFPVVLSQAAAGTVTVDYELGTFSQWLWPGEDFQDDDGGTSGTITFAAGEVSKVLDVHISPDAYFEHNDRIYVELSNLVGDAHLPLQASWAEGRLNAR